jgi:hypothetical protein
MTRIFVASRTPYRDRAASSRALTTSIRHYFEVYPQSAVRAVVEAVVLIAVVGATITAASTASFGFAVALYLFAAIEAAVAIERVARVVAFTNRSHSHTQ